MEYKTINFKRIPLAKLADAQFVAELKEMMNQVDLHNQALYNSALVDWREMIEKAASIYGIGSPVHKYLKKAEPDARPNQFKEWRKLMKRFDEFVTHEHQRQQRRNYTQRKHSAIDELETLGYVEGEDYPFGHAVSFMKKAFYRQPDGRLSLREQETTN